MKNIKVGDKFKGFKFKHKTIYFPSGMEGLVGKIGIVKQVLKDRVIVQFPDSTHWAYPILNSKLKDKLK